ncbi:MAG: penicillin-binding protein activator LpoB [Spirochaetales bacterium]|nr:MAG: penicillin-binding protein activator LpoB [Spirochaetales bacterium]
MLLGSCASVSVKRTRNNKVIDLSGHWNDTDSRLTAENIVADCLARPWLKDFVAENGKKPVVIVGTIRNKSSEHIEVLTFVKDIEKELLNSGKVRFVASSEEREEVRDERLDQQSNATKETAKKLAAETGADYMMKGTITSITDSVKRQTVVKYQVSMELIHLQTNEKVWIGSNEVKKQIKHSAAGW